VGRTLEGWLHLGSTRWVGWVVLAGVGVEEADFGMVSWSFEALTGGEVPNLVFGAYTRKYGFGLGQAGGSETPPLQIDD
jgi:hypothetical protein